MVTLGKEPVPELIIAITTGPVGEAAAENFAGNLLPETNIYLATCFPKQKFFFPMKNEFRLF